MLFSHQNGLSRPVTDDSITQLQELACGIGPNIDGIITSVMQPQSMGAFATQGAASACALRNQQSEQHQPTTMTRRSFGGGSALGSTIFDQLITKTSTAPTTTTLAPTTLLKIAAIQAGSDITRMTMTTKAEATPAAPAPVDPYGPATPLPTTTSYPAGTITAFSASTNMWRVAVPTVAAGLGMFGEAAPYTEIAPVAAPPPAATQVTVAQLEKQTGQLPLWKKWQFWAAVGGGVVVVGTGTALLFRRKRAA
jgi:hypothetical protein